MKLITQFYDLSEAERVSDRMRRAGIMTVVTSKRSYRFSRAKTGAIRVGLWAVLDEQYQDAVKLLENHKHKPKLVLSSAEMSEIQNLSRKQLRTRMKNLIESSATLVFGGLLLALLAILVVGIIHDA